MTTPAQTVRTPGSCVLCGSPRIGHNDIACSFGWTPDMDEWCPCGHSYRDHLSFSGICIRECPCMEFGEARP